MRTLQAGLGLALLLFLVPFIWKLEGMPFGGRGAGAIGSGVFPALILGPLALCVAAYIVSVQTSRNRLSQRDSSEGEGIDKRGLVRQGGYLLIVLLSVALIDGVGLFGAVGFMLVLLAVIFERIRLRSAVIYVAVVTVACYLVFDRLLGVHVPYGVLQPLFGV